MLVTLPAVVDIYNGSPEFVTVAYAAIINPLISMEVALAAVEDLTQIPNILYAAEAFAVVASANAQVSAFVL
jgi:hypothetical protein